MAPIVQIVVVIHIIDVKVIVVVPVAGPGIDILEPIPAILKALASASSTPAALDVEGVFAAEAAPETIIRNATATVGRLPSRVLAALLIPCALTILPIAILLCTITILILPVSILLLRTIAILIAPVSILLLRAI